MNKAFETTSVRVLFLVSLIILLGATTQVSGVNRPQNQAPMKTFVNGW